MYYHTENTWNAEALYISTVSTYKFGAFLENFHFDCIIKTTGGYCQLSRIRQIKLHYIKTGCSQPAYNPLSSNSLQWACILQVSLAQSVFALKPSLGLCLHCQMRSWAITLGSRNEGVETWPLLRILSSFPLGSLAPWVCPPCYSSCCLCSSLECEFFRSRAIFNLHEPCTQCNAWSKMGVAEQIR